MLAKKFKQNSITITKGYTHQVFTDSINVSYLLVYIGKYFTALITLT